MNSPDAKQVAALLQIQNFSTGTEDLPDSGPPVAEGLIRLNLDQIQEFDRNPRRAPNAEHDVLKASLLKTGADKVLLAVTRRPGEDGYFPAAGGNTRLRILKELYRELKQDKYYWINCKFIPYRGEIPLLIDHLAENDNRAEYIFIDRARAVCDLYEQLREEAGGELPQRVFIERMVQMGYPRLSRARFGRYQYANGLYESIPRALDAGMPQKSIVSLKEFHNLLQAFLDSACRSDPEIRDRLESVFPVVLSEHDSADGIDQDAVAASVLALMAPSMEKYSPDMTSDNLAALLEKLWEKYQRNPGFSVSLSERAVSPVERYQPERPGKVHMFTAREINETGHVEAGDMDRGRFSPSLHDSEAEFRAEPAGHEKTVPGAALTDDDEDGSESENPLHRQHRNLMSMALDHAKNLAAAYQIDKLVDAFDRPMGYGYWVDLPEQSRRLDESAESAWWWLLELSGIAEALLMGGEVVNSDARFAVSRFSSLYREIIEGRAGLDRDQIEQMPSDRRNREILAQTIRAIETQIPRKNDHVLFLCELPDSQYASLTSLLNAVRSINRLKERLMRSG